MGTKKRKGDNTPVIQFQTDDSDITVNFSQEESVGMKAVILDIFTEAYRERLQRASLYPKAGWQMEDCAAFRTFIL